MQPDITLILPAYNEATGIAKTVAEAVDYFRSRKLSYQIIVSADGDDGTREIVRDLAKSDPALSAIGEPVRRGKGRGIRDAMALAEGRIVGFADADNKVPIDEYDKLAPLITGETPIVIGSRALARSVIEKRQPWFRRLGSMGFAVFMRTVTGLRDIQDTQCGFKFFQHAVGKRLFELQKIDGYMYDVEILLLAQYLGYKVCEVPIRWHDDNDSRLNLVSGNLRNVRDILRIRALAKSSASTAKG